MSFTTARLAAAFVLAAGLSAPALAQEGAPAETQPEAASQDLPDGFEILERHVEAIGGTERGMEVEGLRMSGTVSVPAMGMTGRITISAAAPAKQLVEVSLPVGNMVQGTNGEKAWMSQPGTQPMMLPDAQAQMMIENADFYAHYQPRERYESATTVGTETIDGETYYTVELVDTDGDESIGVYSAESGLQRFEKTRMAPGSDVFAQEIELLEYEEIDGMKFPKKMLMTQQGMKQEIIFETVEVDPDFGEDAFAAPGGN